MSEFVLQLVSVHGKTKVCIVVYVQTMSTFCWLTGGFTLTAELKVDIRLAMCSAGLATCHGHVIYEGRHQTSESMFCRVILGDVRIE